MKPIDQMQPSVAARFSTLLRGTACLWVVLTLATPIALALDGQIGIHDPSTIMECNGSYYTWGTGGTALVSDDGWTWRSGTRASRGGMAPDVIHVGDRYYMYVSSNPGGQPHSQIAMISSKSLDPESPDYGWEDGGIVNTTDGVEFCNGIDPGLFLDPTTGKLWMTFGSYFGYTRVVELDPRTGKRVDDTFTNIAINCEATTMIYHNGWYYLLATHGSCCRGTDSGYNIRVGRSRAVTGPFLDHEGIDMIQGGGKLVIGSGGRVVGAGHFGLIDEGDGVQKFSLHWEADMDRGNASVVDIRPLLWRDGWPVAGENFKEGTYQIESVRTGTALELDVQGVPVGGGRNRGARGGGGAPGAGTRGGARGGMPGMAPGGAGGGMPRGGARGGMPGMAPGEAPAGMPGGGARGGMPGMAPGEAPAGMARGGMPGMTPGEAPAGMARGGARGGGMFGGGGGGGMFGGSGGTVADQDAAQVEADWPAGDVAVRMGTYLCQAQQKWTITPAADAGGYLGSPYFKITIADTDRTLTVGADGQLVALATYTGAPEQLWRLDQLTDGTWRIMPKAAPNSTEPVALMAIGASSATLAKYDPTSLGFRWVVKMP